MLSQAVFVVVFFVLTAAGKIQLWMGVFFLSVILTVLFGQFYCGWICPINTLMNLVTRIKRGLHIKSLSVPGFVKKLVYRYAVHFGK